VPGRFITLLFDLQDRLFERYETDFMEFMKQDYNAYFKIKPPEK